MNQWAWVALYKPNIVTISETWLHSEISEEINIDNFVMYRAARVSLGGGVATYVSNLVAERIMNYFLLIL